MTDQQTYTDVGGNAELIIFANGIEGLALRSQVNLDDRLPVILCIPAPRLLAMIDRLDPDAMRAYLRETSETQLDGIDAVAAEDVDEPAVIELSDDIDTRLHVIERLAKILRAGTDAVEVCTLADWVIDR